MKALSTRAVVFIGFLVLNVGAAKATDLLSGSEFYQFLLPKKIEDRAWWVNNRYDQLKGSYSREQIHAFYSEFIRLAEADFGVVELASCYDVLYRNETDHPDGQTLQRLLAITDASVELLSKKDKCWGIYRLFCLSEILPDAYQELSEQKFREAVQLAKEFKCYDMYLVGLRSQSRRYFSRGNLSKSLFFSYMGVRVADSASFAVSNFRKAEMNRELGYLHYFMKSYPIALKRFKTAAANYENSEMETNEVKSIYNSIALCFRGMGQYDSALFYFRKSLRLVKAANDQDWIGIVEGNIGDVYYFRKEFEKALPYLWKDIRSSTENNVPESAALSSVRLGKAYLELGKADSATIYLESARTFFETNQLAVLKNRNPKHFFEIEINLLSGLSELAAQKGQYELAVSHLQLLNRKRDSVQKLEEEQNVAWLEADLLMQEHSQEALLLASELEQQRKYNQVAVLAFIGFGAALLILVLFLKQRNNLLRSREALLRAESHQQLEKLHRIESERQAETEINRLEQEKIQTELDRKNRELLSITSEMAHKIDLVNHLNDLVSKAEKEAEKENKGLREMKSALRNSVQTERDFESFKLRFEEVHPRFFQSLSENYPQLTSHDLQLCAYLKMGLANNEIASLMNITQASLKNARYRLKKKMELGNDEGLTAALNAIG